MYDLYPFEDYGTVFKLRKRLTTRLKEEEDKSLVAGWIQGGAVEKD